MTLSKLNSVGAVIAIIGGKRATAFLIWAVLATLAFGVQSWRVDRAKVKGGACAVNVSNFERTQKGNLDTITALERKLAVEATKRRVEAAAHMKAINSLAATVERIDAARASLDAELEKLYAQDQGARDWGTAGVDAGVLDRLPKRPPAR